MRISFIVAADENNAIGKGNKLPWKLQKDMKFFKEITMSKPIVMGRKTFESFGSKPLPGRLNIVVTRDPDFVAPKGVLVYNNLTKAIYRMNEEPGEEGFVIGGGEIYQQAMKHADRIYLTRVHCKIEDADTFFPKIDMEEFHVTGSQRHEADEKNEYPFTFINYERS